MAEDVVHDSQLVYDAALFAAEQRVGRVAAIVLSCIDPAGAGPHTAPPRI